MDKITSYMRVTKKHKTPEVKGALHKKNPRLATSPARASASASAARASIAANPTPTSTSQNDLQLHENQRHCQDDNHVPEFIYKVVKYVRKGQGEKISKEESAIVSYIETYYCVPPDFERDHKFGPHSGLTFEKRLLRAYSLMLLELKNPRKRPTPAPMCITCAQAGHSHHDCPDGF